jgi:hypothetical protein
MGIFVTPRTKDIMAKSFNILSLAIASTADMTVRNASGDTQYDDAGAPLTITLYSPGTKQVQKARHAAEERNNTRVFGRMQGKSDAKQSAEDKANETAEFLAACTVSFNGFGVDGLSGFELFKSVYANIEIGNIAEDSQKFLNERGNFLKSPAKG